MNNNVLVERRFFFFSASLSILWLLRLSLALNDAHALTIAHTLISFVVRLTFFLPFFSLEYRLRGLEGPCIRDSPTQIPAKTIFTS